ncbi:MAG: 2-C-methyl-D-erythritol 2,4-cyclodiphosphate synthase [Oscillospiraceae bacterium]|nr:2-C-methyl-D-erythritol 2,4-cyclodiphosphate synthase [Oscillospiraceae bacterium]
MRIGHGYDVHRFAEGRDLILGGVNIPYSHGLIGHSDADVLIHAVCDALLGALGKGDIGRHFPDTDEAYRGISSLKLLGMCVDMMRERSYRLSNLDATIIAEAPRLAPHIAAMRGNISKAFAYDISRINIKATTEEGLGFTGARLGIAAHCVLIISVE